MLDISSLISPILSLDALNIAGEDKTFRVYLHDQAGQVFVSTGFVPQTITTIVPPQLWVESALQQFARISSRVDVKFERVFNSELADISFYYDSELPSDDSHSTTFGLATTNRDSQSGRQWTEIFFNGPQLNIASEDFVRYVFNHELLHVLGMEHTFDNSDGDFYLSTDPQSSATPEESVMSYRTPVSGVYPVDFTERDYAALTQVWGGVAFETNDDSLNAFSSNQVYRFYNENTGKHLYTSNSNEIDVLTGSAQSGYINEGITYVVGEGADQNLHRFYNQATGLHFYSANDSERDVLLAQSNSEYVYEGVAYQVFNAASPPSGRTPVVRFYDPIQNVHFYSASVEEQLILETTQPLWVMEGTAWYA